ncbi:MAG TPA: transketolase [Paludibacteraceae bacterium]|nr:transketolase [Paludibacteraceae bacterium]HQF49922.1 transketolase [Paludibacteraceae bacterium]HQJ89138.1 transketolase [Paludibacteraceae bacterium]
MKDISQIETMAKAMRCKALEMAFRCGKNGSHLGGGLSAIEILASLYGGILNVDAACPENHQRDRLIVSKGHCVLAYYTALWQSGFLTEKDLETFETNGATFHGHATRNLSYGIEFSGGSLGQGLSFAVGVAMACKKKSLSSHVYALVGDGECDEGIVWEALMAAHNFRLDNFTVVIDCNGLQYDGQTDEVMNKSPLSKKLSSFGFLVNEVDGHDCKSLLAALNNHSEGMPMAIIAHTVKGKGVSFMENRKEWHHSILTEDQYKQAQSEQE